MTKRTEISELGEFGLIEHLSEKIKLFNTSSHKGIGDDAAVIDNRNKLTLVSTDLLIEGVHFDLVYTPMKHLGYKAAVVNFSDIYAMNATPKQITVSIAISNRFSLEAIDELYEGIRLACNKYKVDIVGGDTTSSLSGLFISITVIGEAEEGEIVYRNTANENDLICVTGSLGGAYTGLLLLEREKHEFEANPNMQPNLEGCEFVLEKQLKPEARIDIIEALKQAGIKPTAMIDISDGLASEIMHICKQSDKGCRIYDEKLPIEQIVMQKILDFNIDPSTAAFNGGEDYELLFTINIKDFAKIQLIPDIKIIGNITQANEGINIITKRGEMIPITAQGWDALKV